MNFNNHSNLEGQHAFLGASKYHWINYSEDKVADAYSKFLARVAGHYYYGLSDGDIKCCTTTGRSSRNIVGYNSSNFG